jgi:hypothetical protein
MGTHTQPNPNFGARLTSLVTAAAVTLSGMPATAAPNPPATLTKDADNTCRVVVIDNFTTKNYPIFQNQDPNNPIRSAYVKQSHGDLVTSTAGAGQTYPSFFPKTPEDLIKLILSPPIPEDLIDPKKTPAIVNLSFVRPTFLDENGEITKKLEDTFPLKAVAKLINKFIDPSFPADKTLNQSDIIQYQERLIELIYNLHEPQKTDSIDIAASKIVTQESISSIRTLIKKGYLVINAAGNSGPGTISLLSLIPGVVTVAAQGEKPNTYEPYSSTGLPGSTILGNGTIRAEKITPDSKSPSGYSVTLSNNLVTPVYFGYNKYEPNRKINPLDITISQKNQIPIWGTSFAAPERARAASQFCRTLNEPDPAKRLADTRDWLLQRGNGR